MSPQTKPVKKMNKHLKSWRNFLVTTAAFFLAFQNVSAQTSDSIPFLFRGYNQGHLYIPVTINDSIHCNVVFDTGASDLFGVDSVFLAHSGWKPQNFYNARTGGTAGNTMVKIIADQTKINIGNIEDYYGSVLIMQLRNAVSCHADGILGIKNIADYPFEINFEHKYLKQIKSGKPDTKDYIKVPIQYKGNRIMLQAAITIGGKTIKGWYLMDTGSGGSVDFTAQTVKQYGLNTVSGKRYITDVAQLGIGDKTQEWQVDMMPDRIVIGNDTLKGVPVSYFPEGAGAFSNRPYVGVIGNGVWSKYNIIIDVKNSMLYLHRFNSESLQKPTYDYRFKNRTDIGKGWVVASLVRDGDAANARMELGDVITAINGKNVADYSWEEECDVEFLSMQEIDIIGSDGCEKHITLEPKNRW